MKDTRDLTAEQMGAYVFLLDEQWKKGALPADVEALGSIAKLTPPRMRKALLRYGDRLRPHPARPGMIYNAFMERVRQQQYEKYLRRSGAGKKGAEARYGDSIASGNAKSNANGNANGNASPDIENRDIHSASPREGAGAYAREAAKKSPAFAFCEWMLDEGLKAGAINAHHGGDRFAWCYPNWPDAEKLFEHYDEAEIRVRAQRLIAMKAARKLRRDVTPAMLLEAWGWDQISGKFDLTSGSSMTDVEGL